MKKNLVKLATTGTIAAMMLIPSLTFADGFRDHRASNDRNQWSNLAIGAGAVGLIGLLSNNSTLATIGLAGAGYSVYRADTVRGYDCYRPTFDRHDVRFDGHRPDRRGR